MIPVTDRPDGPSLRAPCLQHNRREKPACTDHLAVQLSLDKDSDWLYLAQKRWRSSVFDVASTRHSTVLNSHNKVLLAKTRSNLKTYSKTIRQNNLDMATFQIPAALDEYRDSLRLPLPTSVDDLITETAWSSVRNAISASASRSLPTKGGAHMPWLSLESLAIIARKAKCRSKKMMKKAKKQSGRVSAPTKLRT